MGFKINKGRVTYKTRGTKVPCVKPLVSKKINLKKQTEQVVRKIGNKRIVWK